MATTASFPTELKPIRTSPSFSSISMSSKSLLSFTKGRKSISSPSKSKPPLSPMEETLRQPARPTQGNARRVSVRDSIAIREPVYSGKRTSIRKRASTRITATLSVNGQSEVSVPAQTSRLFHRRKGSDKLAATGLPAIDTGSSKDRAPRAARSGIMRRITRRLQSPHQVPERGELPIQRVPSLRRQPSRLSHRSSRVRSYRNSSFRPSSTRLSRASTHSGQSTPSVALHSIGAALGQEVDSNYSTESEADEAPITMRSVRLQRVRASTVFIGATATVTATIGDDQQPPLPPFRAVVPPARTPLADLIEEIAEELEGRHSRDTLDSNWDFSLDQYCKAFPVPPSPGFASNGLFASSEKIHQKPSPLAENVTRSHTPSQSSTSSASPNPVQVEPLDLSPSKALNEPVTQNMEDWNDWSFPETSPSLRLGSGSSSTSIVSKSESSEMGNNQRAKSSRVAHQHRQSSVSTVLSSTLSSTPVTPATPSFARPRSADPLAQARRKTRIVFGHVLEGVDDELLTTTNDATANTLRAGRNSPLWWGSSAALSGSQPSLDRRGSDKSSVLSLMTPDQAESQMDIPVVSFENNVYSLNSPHEEITEIGVALTTESRQVASPSPSSIIEQDARLTLFARRKGRRANESISKSHLRLEPATPPMPPLPEHFATTTTSYNPSQLPSVYEDAIPVRSPTNRAFAPSPPVTAPPKRKSFFRYPFLSSRRSVSNIKLSNPALTRTASPPLASPRAIEPPLSASARNHSFTFLNHPAISSLSASASSMQSSKSRPSTPPKFKSFSRPSSSGKHI